MDHCETPLDIRLSLIRNYQQTYMRTYLPMWHTRCLNSKLTCTPMNVSVKERNVVWYYDHTIFTPLNVIVYSMWSKSGSISCSILQNLMVYKMGRPLKQNARTAKISILMPSRFIHQSECWW